jgi:UDP-glucose 4-epimerase
MRVLVTGGAGFIGSHLVDALVGRGDEVLVLDNFRRGLMKQVQDMDYSFSTNVVGTFNVLKAASAAAVRRVVFSSSREVYGEPDEIPVQERAPLRAKNPYGASKIAGELYCGVSETATSMDCKVLRFANVYGPRDRDRVIPHWLKRAQDGERLEVYGGQQIIDFVWVGCAVDALLAAATCAIDGPVNVGSGVGTPIIALGERILALSDTRSELRVMPARDIEVVRFVADVARMRSLLGVEPVGDPLDKLATMTAPFVPA